MALLLAFAPESRGQLPAFPGAEGEGMYVSGGRGGDVYHVTNLNDSGPGSLRYGLDDAPATGRTIVFDVSGMIHLSSMLRFRRPNVTVAGQTAPGIGICLRNYGATISAENIILRHLRFRPGDARKGPPPGFSGDSLSISASRVLVDHCSASWGIDEGLSSAGAGSHDVTVQYCFITEGLDQTGLYHDEWNANYDPGGSGHHSMGSLIKPVSGSGQVTYHHNFWACNRNRNPGVGTYDATQAFKADIRNNVLYNNYNNGYRSAGPSSRFDLNYVGNYVIAGLATSSSWRVRAFDAKNEDANFYIYQSENRIDGNLNPIRDGTDTGWGMFVGAYNRLNSPAAMRPTTSHSPDEAYRLVVNGAGALPWERDSVDARLVQNLLAMSGGVIDSQEEVGGYPDLPIVLRPAGWDTDGDGLPDYWETALGQNPMMPNNNEMNADGYTDLEHYLNWVAEPHGMGAENAHVDIDLRVFSLGMASNATFTALTATNGTVALLADGHTARFVPPTDFSGRASFGFAATDTSAVGGMTNMVRLLITPVLTPPLFTGVAVSSDQVVLQGEGGSPYARFVLLATTNLSSSANSWMVAATNRLDASGRFLLTNTPPSNTAATFYQLQFP